MEVVLAIVVGFAGPVSCKLVLVVVGCCNLWKRRLISDSSSVPTCLHFGLVVVVFVEPDEPS